MLRNKQVFKHETKYNLPYTIIHTWTNGTIILRMGDILDIIGMFHLKNYYPIGPCMYDGIW